MTTAERLALSQPGARGPRRRRRPSGAPPPLPRSLGFTGKGWLVLLAAVVVWIVVTLNSAPAQRVTDRVDAAMMRWIARLRTDWLSDVMRTVNRVGSGWTMMLLAVGLAVLLIVFRRWRHLFTFVASVFVTELVGVTLHNSFVRPRPHDVTIIGDWRGHSMPSAPVAVLALILVPMIYSLVVAGRPRTIAKVAGMAIVGLLIVARLYLGIDHPFDILVAVVLGVAIPLNSFRFFVPNEVFPVSYRRGKTAHLDVGGRRGEAIRQAVQNHLGAVVLDVKHIGLAGSGGSTPLRIRLEGNPDTYVFGKLYAMNHVRADRWYKLGRTILYGRLEDEAPFQSVRRLVQFEDYALRAFRDAGIRTANPLGIVELTPEREYLLLTDFIDGAEEIGDAVVDEQLIDEGLALIRQLWDAGIAHRDIKPANLLVKDGHLYVIDVAFAQVLSSPWREAVDLANMMLVLAVRADAETVYRRALVFFSPDEIAEAFAAARGVASPSQLRAAMKQDGRNLLAQFRALAPERRPISLQRWGPRRVILALALLFVTFESVQLFADLFTPADIEISGRPSCGTGKLVTLVAQSVPSATQVPCLLTLPAGWELDSVIVRSGYTRYWLNSDLGGRHAMEVQLRPPEQCDTTDAVEIPSDQVGMRRFEQPDQRPPGLVSTRYYLFSGGCVTYRFRFDDDANASLMFDAEDGLGFQPRQELVDAVHARTGLRLCGAGAPECPGG